MAPQRRGLVTAEMLDRITRARALAAEADQLVKDAVVMALVDGASYPELHKATGIAQTTMTRWVREAGAVTAGRVRHERDRAAADDWEARLAAAERVARSFTEE